MSYTIHKYKKVDNIVLIYEYNDYFILLKDSLVSQWDSKYNDTKLRQSYRKYIRNNILQEDIAFKSLSSVTSFIYGKPCDIKTTIIEKSLCNFNTDTLESRFIKAIESLNLNNMEDNINMSEKPDIIESLKNYTTAELVDFFSSNMLIGSGAMEIARANVIGHNIGKSIMSELISLLPSINSEVKYIEPYKNSLVVVKRDSEEYKTALNSLSMILNYDDVYKVVDLLKTRGVCLSGKAGIGKGVIANNIGAEILWNNASYDSYANLVVSCASSINPNNVTWGTGMNNVEVLGAVYTASKFSTEHPNTAVVLVLDELFDCDWKSVLGKALEFFSDKTRGTSSIMTNGDIIKYENNLFIIVTGNAGKGFGHADINDERFKTRFVDVKLSGLFHSRDTVLRYLSYMSTLLDDESKIEDYTNVLFDIFESLEDETIDRTISLRALNTLVVTAKSKKDFEDGVYNLFSSRDRRSLIKE